MKAEHVKPVNGLFMVFIIRLRLFEQGGRMAAEPIKGFGPARREAFFAANAQFYLKRAFDWKRANM